MAHALCGNYDWIYSSTAVRFLLLVEISKNPMVFSHSIWINLTTCSIGMVHLLTYVDCRQSGRCTFYSATHNWDTRLFSHSKIVWISIIRVILIFICNFHPWAYHFVKSKSFSNRFLQFSIQFYKFSSFATCACEWIFIFFIYWPPLDCGCEIDSFA